MECRARRHFTNNIVRHTAGAFNILGYDDTQPAGSQRTQRITIRNNLFYDIDPSRWGGGADQVLSPGSGCDRRGVRPQHDRSEHDDGPRGLRKPTVRFAFTNNIALHGTVRA